MTKEELAKEYATHKIDCTCKGNHFSQDKYDAFKAGWESCMKEAELFIDKHLIDTAQRWLAQQDKIEALEKELEKAKS